MTWFKRQQPRTQLAKNELEDFLLSNAFTPVYIVSKKDVIAMKLLYDEDNFVGYNYLKTDQDGNPGMVTINQDNYPILLAKISDNYSIYTVHGVKSVLDKLDKTSPV